MYLFPVVYGSVQLFHCLKCCGPSHVRLHVPNVAKRHGRLEACALVADAAGRRTTWWQAMTLFLASPRRYRRYRGAPMRLHYCATVGSLAGWPSHACGILRTATHASQMHVLFWLEAIVRNLTSEESSSCLLFSARSAVHAPNHTSCPCCSVQSSLLSYAAFLSPSLCSRHFPPLP